MSGAVTEEERAVVESIASTVYEGVARDLGACHVSDFYDLFYNEVTIVGFAARWPGMGRKQATNPALEGVIERVKQLDPAIERIVISHMRRRYADRKGMLRP